jgi:hypothetical protein
MDLPNPEIEFTIGLILGIFLAHGLLIVIHFHQESQFHGPNVHGEIVFL